MVKLLEFSTKKIARQEAQAEALKPTRRAIFTWRALALALSGATGVAPCETLSSDDLVEAVNLFSESLGLLFPHLPEAESSLQLDCSSHGQAQLNEERHKDDEHSPKEAVAALQCDTACDKHAHHSNGVDHGRHLQPEEEHGSLLSREAQLKVKGTSCPKRLPLSKKLIYISIIE